MTFTKKIRRFWRSEFGLWMMALFFGLLLTGFYELLRNSGIGVAVRLIAAFAFTSLLFYCLLRLVSGGHNENADE